MKAIRGEVLTLKFMGAIYHRKVGDDMSAKFSAPRLGTVEVTQGEVCGGNWSAYVTAVVEVSGYGSTPQAALRNLERKIGAVHSRFGSALKVWSRRVDGSSTESK